MPHGYTDWEWFWMSPEQKANATTAEQNASIASQQSSANAAAEERQRKAFEQQQAAIAQSQKLYSQIQDPAYQQQQRQNIGQVASEQAERAGGGAGRQANTAARTAGLNPGQAAATGSRAASDVYSAYYNQAYGQQQQASQAQINQMIQNLQLQMGINPGQQGQYGTQGMQQGGNGTMDSVIGAAAGVAGAVASDERLKDGIKETKLLDPVGKSVKSIEFTYKTDPNRPEVGISAQDLEKTPLKTAVIDTPQGKMVDTRRLTTANTGMISEMARKLAENSKKVDQILDFYKKAG